MKPYIYIYVTHVYADASTFQDSNRCALVLGEQMGTPVQFSYNALSEILAMKSCEMTYVCLRWTLLDSSFNFYV